MEEGEIVLCTVEKIIGTTVFVKIEGDGEGTIVTSEIAPGRIRNLRDYVVPQKKIVCKVLRMSNNRIDLSLRRVTSKEKKDVMERYDMEKSSEVILKSILKEKALKVIEEIKKQDKVYDFLQKSRQDNKLLEKYMEKEESEKILKILNEKKEKAIEVKQNFMLRNRTGSGILSIRKILQDTDAVYLGNSRFSLTIKGKDYKQANHQLTQIMEKIMQEAKKLRCEFEEVK